MPIAIGQARVEGNGRGRSVLVYGTTDQFPATIKVAIGQGEFLPAGDPRRGGSVAVLGPKLKHELFGEANALGQSVRIAGSRLRVIGVMASKGQVLGMDIDDAAYIPVATAMRLFNLEELQEIHVMFAHEGLADAAVEAARAVLIDRHRGEEDFTIVSQSEMLSVFGRVMDVADARGRGHRGDLAAGRIDRDLHDDVDLGRRAGSGDRACCGRSARPAEQIRDLFLVEAILLTTAGGIAGLVGGGLIVLARALVAAGVSRGGSVRLRRRSPRRERRRGPRVRGRTGPAGGPPRAGRSAARRMTGQRLRPRAPFCREARISSAGFEQAPSGARRIQVGRRKTLARRPICAC